MKKIVNSLLNWYDANARILPWRSQPTPYRVWISEIMLQQTRVAAVKPYFDRFTKALPEVSFLARAEEEELLKLWEGLGYYNRVRNLQTAAQDMMKRFDGKLPNTYEELLSLKGIGPYTAGAIASIAYGIPMPAVDGNVLRVISRVMASTADIGQEKVKREMSEAIRGILPKKRAGDFNQALMELGATICLPKGVPKCESCPIGSICAAYAQDIVMELPRKAKKKPRTIQEKTLLILTQGGKTAIRKRKAQGLLAGLWEYPNMEGLFTKQEIQAVLSENGITARNVQEIGGAKHIFTHIEWYMMGYAIEVEDIKGEEVPLASLTENLIWAGKEEIEKIYSVPSAFGVYTDFVLNHKS